MANAKQRRRRSRQRRRQPSAPTSVSRQVAPADWDATEDYPDSGARPVEPVEHHDAARGPVLAMVPARRGLGLNLVLLLGGTAALVGFGIWLLRA